MPWSEIAEQSVLGACLIDPATPGYIEHTGLTAGSFFAVRHRRIWSAITTLVQCNRPVDVVTVEQALRDAGHGDDGGGLVYLNALAQSVPSAANARRYAEIVVEKHLDRELIETADTALSIARGAGSAAERLDAMQAALARLERKTGGSGSAPVPLSTILAEVIDRANFLHENGGDAHAILTGFCTLDKVVGGLRPGNVIVLASRPSGGKTSIASAISQNAAAAGHPVLILSMEMTRAELGARAAASLGGIDLGALTTGALSNGDWSNLSEAAEYGSRLPIFVDDTPALTLLQIRTRARQVKGLRLLIVDYLQLASGTGQAQSRHHEIERLSRGLKALAKEIGVSILLLSQLNRQSTQRAEGEPSLSDLKESGALEEDADVVIVLHPKASLAPGVALVAALVLKNRQGRRGRIGFEFDGRYQRWTESDADVSAGRV